MGNMPVARRDHGIPSAVGGLSVLVSLFAAVLIVVGIAPAAHADPAGPDSNNATLQSQLDAAARGYNDAKGRLDTAKQRLATLNTAAQTTQTQLADLTQQVNAVAVTAYKGGQISAFASLLDSGSPADFLDRAVTLQAQVHRDDATLRRLNATQAQYAQQRADIDTEVQRQADQVAVMARRKTDAQNALAAAGSGPSAGFSGGSVSAAPAARSPDGSWPKESCSIKDPTTSGCLTPRALHALQEVKKAGYTHYVACYRPGTFGEHPLGRACDFAANPTGFAGIAAGADKAYGAQLAAWLVANADRLAVLYVIWFKQIWTPSAGWHAYHGDGTPGGDHTNHVHLSVQ